jgi:hypothetical protein
MKWQLARGEEHKKELEKIRQRRREAYARPVPYMSLSIYLTISSAQDRSQIRGTRMAPSSVSHSHHLSVSDRHESADKCTPVSRPTGGLSIRL